MKTLHSLVCLLTAPILVLSLGATVHAADSMVSASDKMFVKKAAMGGMFEVQTSKMASDMGMDQSVKDFGSKMVEDHGKANDELKGLASSKGVEVPMELDAKHMKMVDALKAKSGKDFDMLYLKDMKKAHMMDDELFMDEASSSKDADLKGFADKTDKVIKMHISMLKDTMKSMK